jgi:dTDP-4-amino-4,6-dideoxygalactose transaminase
MKHEKLRRWNGLEGTDLSNPIPFLDLEAQRNRIRAEIERAVARVLDHGQYILGPEVGALEEALAASCGSPHCIACANGTDALTLVMMAEGIGPGDAVLTPSFTFVATAEAVASRGATPVFVDVFPDSFNLDSESLEGAIGAAKEAGLRPRMVVAVDLFGQPADYDAITAVARRHGLATVADAAQSFGASIGPRKVGTLAEYTTTSFFPAKPLGCYGDGGAVFTGSVDQASVLRSLRMHGQGKHKYDNVRVGVNSRLDTLQAAILLEKLKIFPSEIEARNAAALRYHNGLGNVARTPAVPEPFTSVWAQYTIVLPEGVEREAVQAACARSRVPTAVYYPKPLHVQSPYAKFPRDPEGLAITEALASRVLSLPMHAYLTTEIQNLIVDVLVAATQRAQG